MTEYLAWDRIKQPLLAVQRRDNDRTMPSAATQTFAIRIGPTLEARVMLGQIDAAGDARGNLTFKDGA